MFCATALLFFLTFLPKSKTKAPTQVFCVLFFTLLRKSKPRASKNDLGARLEKQAKLIFLTKGPLVRAQGYTARDCQPYVLSKIKRLGRGPLTCATAKLFFLPMGPCPERPMGKNCAAISCVFNGQCYQIPNKQSLFMPSIEAKLI